MGVRYSSYQTALRKKNGQFVERGRPLRGKNSKRAPTKKHGPKKEKEKIRPR